MRQPPTSNLRRQPGGPFWLHAALLVLSTSILACGSDDGTTPFTPTPSRLEITTPEPLVPVGGTLTLTARVLDQTGASMSGVGVTWASDDPTTATIEAATGLVRGVAGGEVRIQARAGSLSAEITALIHYQVAADQAKLRFRDGDEHAWEWDNVLAAFQDNLAPDGEDYSTLELMSAGFWDATELLLAVLPGRLSVGAVELQAVAPETILGGDAPPLTTPFIFLLREASATSGLMYVSETGWIDCDHVTLPAQAGERQGEIRGRMNVKLNGYSLTFVGDEAQITPLGTQATLYADFWAPTYHMYRPHVSLELTGGPHPGVTETTSGSYHYMDQLDVGSFDISFAPPGDEDGWSWLDVRAPGELAKGSWPLTGTGPMPPLDEYAAEIRSLSDAEPTVDWFSESGVLRIDSIVPRPADDLAGAVHGSITADFVGWTLLPDWSYEETIDHLGLTATFHVGWGWSGPWQAPERQQRSGSWITKVARWHAVR